MTVVVDANVVLSTVTSASGPEALASSELIAPPLLWPEARSALHVAVARGLLARPVAVEALQLIESGLVRERRPRRLGRETWVIADELGWSKTYDAEYLALCRLTDAPLLTLDARMVRAAARVGVEIDGLHL